MRFVKRFRRNRDRKGANVSEEGRGKQPSEGIEVEERKRWEERRGEERRMGK